MSRNNDRSADRQPAPRRDVGRRFESSIGTPRRRLRSAVRRTTGFALRKRLNVTRLQRDDRAPVDVSGDHYVDLELEALAVMKRE
jgi:hypothetical protein